MTEYINEFVQESEESITQLNNALLDLERNPDDGAAMDQVFRTAHTLKGNTSAMGFDRASDLAHVVEDLLDAIRAGSLEVTPELMDEVFEGVDLLDRMIDEVDRHGEPRTDPSDRIRALRSHIQETTGLTKPSADEMDVMLEDADAIARRHRPYHVRLSLDGGPDAVDTVVDAIDDAFDLMATDPALDVLDDRDPETLDVAFGSAVDEASIAAALDPVEAVQNAIITEVPEEAVDRAVSEEPEDEPEEGPEETEPAVDPDEMEVDELLDEFDEYDDLDEAVEQVEDVSGLEDLGEAGAFDDIVEDDVTPAHEEAGDVSAETGSAGEADATTDADTATETDAEPAGDEAVDDPMETFSELQDEVDQVGIDRMEEELEGVSFGEYDADDEVGFDELVGDELAEGEAPTAGAEVEATEAPGSETEPVGSDTGDVEPAETDSPEAEPEPAEAETGPADAEPEPADAEPEPADAQTSGSTAEAADAEEGWAASRVAPPDDRAIEAAVDVADPPVAADRRSFLVRVGVRDDGEGGDALGVLEALRDAFDLLGTRPSEDDVAAGDHGDYVDAVFGSDLGEGEIRSALDSIGEVADAALVEVTDRMPEPAEPEPSGTTDTSVSVPDDADPDAVEEVDEEVLAAEGEIEDAHSEFKQMQAAYDEVGLDEIESELEGVSFGEYEAEDEVGFDELIGEEVEEEVPAEADDVAEADQSAEVEEEADEPAEAATSEDEAEPAVTPPSEEALDEAVEAADPPSDPDHSVYAVRLGVVESDRHNNGVRVVEALRDAFDLLGTRPPEQEIADGEFDRTIDAVFGSHVGEAEIRSALDPVDEVAGAAVVDVSDRAPEPTAPTPDDGTSVGEFDLPDDADVDAVEEVDEEVLAAEGEIEDAHSEFKQMQAAYDEVGLDEIESELEGVSFGEYESDDEVEFDELIDEDVDEDAAEPEIEEPAASGAEGPAATEAEEPVATEAEEPAVSDVEEPADPEPTETAEPADTAEAGGVEASDDDFGVDETEFGDVDVRDGEFAEVESDAGDLSEVEAGEFGEDEGFGDPDGVEFDEAEEFDDTDVDAELGGDLADADAGFDAADEPDDVAVDDVEVGEFDVGDEATGADTADEDFGEVDVGETDFGDVEVGDSGVPEDAEADVDTIRGIGPAYADRLADADVDTVGDLVESDPGTLATATGISETRVEEWIERAPVDPGDMASPADVEPADEEAAAEGFGGTDAVEPETEPEPAVEPEHQVDEIQSIRVDVTQVDDLLNMVEGLVTTRARLRRAIQEGAPMEQLEEELEELDVISSEMQDTVMEMRLVPVRAVTQRLPRVVRDIARDRGKQVRFETEGENVEVDRSILDRIGDPLVHMVRNAVDHGIESPEEREAAGKEPEGTVTLRARRDRDRITIEVEDDGRGLDPDELRQNAVEEGVLVEEAAEALDDDDAYDLIFESGFSTSEEVTEVSGRGVGMDVVASVVDELDGEVEVESTPGEGTTVRLVLPVTLAISEMLFLESGDEEYGLPVQVVDEIGAMGMAETVEAEGGGRAIRTPDGQERELIQLHDALDVPDPAATDGGGMLVTVEDDVRSCAIHCDNVRGQQEVVVKPFEGLLANIPGLGGATILGEGAVVNILDVETL